MLAKENELRGAKEPVTDFENLFCAEATALSLLGNRLSEFSNGEVALAFSDQPIFNERYFKSLKAPVCPDRKMATAQKLAGNAPDIANRQRAPHL